MDCQRNSGLPLQGFLELTIFKMHPKAIIVCDEDATSELKVKTVKYFKGLEKTKAMD